MFASGLNRCSATGRILLRSIVPAEASVDALDNIVVGFNPRDQFGELTREAGVDLRKFSREFIALPCRRFVVCTTLRLPLSLRYQGGSRPRDISDMIFEKDRVCTPWPMRPS